MGNLLLASVPSLIAVVLLWRGLRPVGERELGRFATRFSVVIEDASRSLVTGRVRRSRSLRSSAAAAGVVVSGLPAYMNLIDAERSADFAIAPVGQAWLLGAAVAAVAAEVLVVQRPARKGEAAIAERRPDHYVSARWPRSATALSAAAVMLFLVSAMRGDDGLLVASTGAAGAVIALIAVSAGLRRIADRPRLDTVPHLRAIDDALRSYGAHHVAGAAVALGAASLHVAAIPLFNEIAPGLNLVTSLMGTAALIVWYTVARDEPWPVAQLDGTSQ